MCTLEIPQKLFAAQVLALNLFVILTFEPLSQMSISLNYELFKYFCFCFFFHSYGSFNHTTSTSLSFSEFSELFLSTLLLSQLIESNSALSSAGVTSDIIMSVLHESFIFFAPLCIFDVLLVSFHHASSRFLRAPVCSSSGFLLIGPEASHLATIQRWGNT